MNAKVAGIVLLVLVCLLVPIIALDSHTYFPSMDQNNSAQAGTNTVAPAAQTPEQSSALIMLVLQSSCPSERANVTYTNGNQTEQKTADAPAIVNAYPLDPDEGFFDISAQDDSEMDDDGNPVSDCVDVHVSIWSFQPSSADELSSLVKMSMRRRVAYVVKHGQLLNQANSSERYGIAEAPWHPQR